MKKRGKALITDGVHPILLEGLEGMGFDCDYQPDIPLNQVLEVVGGYEGLVINSKIIAHRELLDKAKRLRFIARLGSGMEIIDQDHAAQLGIHVVGAPEGNRNAVAEHALGMLLALANKLPQADRHVRGKRWDREANRGFELMGKTIGIIGFGHTGTAFASKLSGLSMRVLAHDKYKIRYAEAFPHVEETGLAHIHAEADIISLHLPLNNETRHLVNDAFITHCKQGCILINTSRGGIVDTEALVPALEDGRLGGAALDVFENEKPQTFSPAEHALYDRLHALPNTLLSTHVAGWTLESKRRLAEVILEKLGMCLGF